MHPHIIFERGAQPSCERTVRQQALPPISFDFVGLRLLGMKFPMPFR